MKLSLSTYTGRLASLLVLAGFMLAAPRSHAALIFSVQPTGSYSAGSTGNILDIVLTNTDGSAVTISGFSFGITSPTPNISFTAVSTSTNPAYVFAGNSLFGPDISVSSLPGQSLSAQDLHDTDFATVASGATVGLGHVTFDIAPGTAAGPILLSFVANESSLADGTSPSPSSLAFQLTNGTINVTEAAIPEPATVALTALGLLTLGLRTRCKRTRNQ